MHDVVPNTKGIENAQFLNTSLNLNIEKYKMVFLGKAYLM